MSNWTASMCIIRCGCYCAPTLRLFSTARGTCFSTGLFKAIAAYGHKEKKRCLSAEEMNQFASMNHHSVSRNSSSICSGSWPFVARFSLSVCCFTHIAQLRGGKSPSECRASINPTRSRPGLTRSLWVSVSTENHSKSTINKSFLLSNEILC